MIHYETKKVVTMPRASILTSENVARAASELLAQGKPVTNAAVHELVGGGSMSTLAPLLRAWREEQRKVTREEIEVPDAVMEQLRDLAMRLWREATEEAQAATDALRRDMTDMRTEAERQYAELLDDLRGVEAERDAAKDMLEQVKASLAELEDEKSSLSEELNKLRAEQSALQERCGMLEAAKTEADDRATRADDRLTEFFRRMRAETGGADSGTVEPVGSGEGKRSPKSHG